MNANLRWQRAHTICMLRTVDAPGLPDSTSAGPGSRTSGAGNGSFAEVWKARTPSGELVALKIGRR